MDLYGFDESVRSEGFTVIAGVDEAGRGPLAGPVVAAAVVLPRDAKIDRVRDSKKVPEVERESLFRLIVLNALSVGIGSVEAGDIDRTDILRATRKAMCDAVAGLDRQPDVVLIDGISVPGILTPQVPVIKGDAKSFSIAAASIVAKVVRDRIMRRYHRLYPEYGFDRHKGYATQEHLSSLRRLGPCPVHRKSFDRVMTVPLFIGGG
ncbi:MAG TPA: ribonuclease HII [Dissulfurispiraceae bacterium]|nr:ribonuclease HII [Dissulfurispiraceae bacterium]